MDYSSHFLSLFFQKLNSCCGYAVLRNYEGLPEHNNSRDIDIAIEESDYRSIKGSLFRLVEDCGWKIITYLHSDRLITWVVAHLGEDHQTDVIQLDFFFHTSIFGFKLLSAQECLKDRQFNGTLYYPSKEIEFLDKYLYDRAVGAAYPEKYAATKDAVVDNEYVKSIIQRNFGVSSIEACDKGNSRKMLLHLVKKSFLANPLAATCNFLKFEWNRIRNYCFTPTGFSIGFTGPDGSGKTTVVDLMIERLGEVFRKAHAYYHFRPSLYGNISDVAHSAGLKKAVDKNYSDPHRGGKTGVLSSLARLGYYALDYILGYFVKVKSVTRITRLVIFDRYYTDIICDSRRTRVYLPYKFLYWFGRVFIPSLDYNILLTAKSETILARKKELDEAGIRSINEKIDYLADKPGYYKVMNEGTPDEAVSKILEIVFEGQHRKNLKRI